MRWNNYGLLIVFLLAWFLLNCWILPWCGLDTRMSGNCMVIPDITAAPTSMDSKIMHITTSNAEYKKMGGLLEFSDVNFENEVLKSSRPVLVDFSAAWCGPCKLLAPVVEELASENADSAKIGKIDIDANPRTAARYGVSSIPTLMVFKDGRVIDTLVGLQPKSKLQEAIDRAGN